MAEEIQAAVQNAIANSMAEIVNQTASAVKRSMTEDLNNVVEKKVKLEETPHLKRKFNEQHFRHSKEVEKIMDKIMASLNDKDIDKAKEHVTEGKKIIAKRQKMIKIADREEDGWEVIRCYQSDALASDSDDEKRLVKSRRQAKQNKKDARIRKVNYRKRFEQRSNYKEYRDSYTSNSRSYKEPVCYFCGREGHMQYNCPSRRNTKGH